MTHPATPARPRDPSTAHGDPGRPHTHTTPPTGTDGASARREGPCAGGTRVCEVCGGADPDEGCQGCGGVGGGVAVTALDPATLRALEDVIAVEGVTGTAERLGVSRSTLRRIRRGGPLWATTAARVAKEVWK